VNYLKATSVEFSPFRIACGSNSNHVNAYSKSGKEKHVNLLLKINLIDFLVNFYLHFRRFSNEHGTLRTGAVYHQHGGHLLTLLVVN
jgi:hypothetical protein